MRWQTTFSAAACLFLPARAIFSDDAYHLDYHHALLGVPLEHATHFHKPQLSSDASLIYSISDKAVLGAIKPKDGSIVWRQALAGKPATQATDAHLAVGREGTVFSGYENIISAWDALDGRLLWDLNLPKGQRVKGLQSIPATAAEATSVGQDIVLLAGPEKESSGASVSKIGGVYSKSKWVFKDTSITHDTEISIATSPKHVFYITKSSGLLGGGKVKVVVLDVETGAEVSQYSVAMDSQPLGDAGTNSIGSCSGTPFLVSSEKPFKLVKFNLLGNTKIGALTLEDKGEEIERLSVHVACGVDAPPHFLVHARSKSKQWAEVFHIDLKTGDAKKAYSLPATSESSTFAAGAVGDTTYFARITDTEVSLYSSESHGQLGRWTRAVSSASSIGNVVHAAIEVSARGKSGLAIRSAITTDVGEWSLIRNGEVQWSRAEILAHIVKAVWSEDSSTTSLAQEIQAEAASNPASAYIHRLTRHMQDLASLPQYLMTLPESILKPNDDASASVREKLVGGKLVLGVTNHHQLFAIDAAHAGLIKWRLDLAAHLVSECSVVHLLVEEGILTVFGSDGTIVAVDVATGQLLEAIKSGKPFGRLVILPGFPAPSIVSVSADGTPSVFADLAPSTPSEGNTVVTISEQGEASGWTIGTATRKTWTIRPPGAARFVHATSRAAHDPVASIGKVLGDRSVLYKYVSPNVVLLTALSSSSLTVYLVNAVTGAILHTANHEGVLTDYPTPAVVSENWFAYSFTLHDVATSGLSTQIVVSELYESEMTNDRGPLSGKTNYSSFSADAGAGPFVLSQSYTLAAPLSNLTVTQTLQGIPIRQLLAIVPDLDAVVGIPRFALDARRPVDRDANADEAEEGLFKYSPILELDPKYFLSHSREVLGLKNIMTTPTLLESTSMIFAYGHDIFGTQVSPSNTFDVLGKGFKKVQLLLTVVALYVGVVFLRPLVRKKMVERRFL